MKLRLSRERMVRSGLVFALLTGVPVATFGAGYRGSEAVLDSASAFLQREHRLVRVNLETGDVDAEAARELATGDERLTVVQVRPGVVFVVNQATGEVWRMPTDTLAPQPVDTVLDQDGQAGEVTGDGGRAYLLDPERGQLTLLEDEGTAPMSEVPLPAGGTVDTVVVDRSGTAWALSEDRGELYRIVGPAVERTHAVPHPGQPAELTLAGDLPVVYQPTAGVAAIFDQSGEVRRVDGLPAAERSNVLVAAPGTDPRVLVVAVRGTGELFAVDFRTGRPSPPAQLPDRADSRLGAPVVAHGLVYLPDYTHRQVVVVDLQSLREIRTVAVKGQGDFEIVARDGWVRVNNPYGALLTFDKGGHPRELDGIPEPDRDPAPDRPDRPEPSPSPSPESSPEPGDRPDPDRAPSASPEPDDRPEPAPVVVPDVIGTDRLAACDELAGAGLDCRPEPQVQAGCPTGQVVSAEPAVGSRVPAGTEVRVVFCTPPRTVVPPSGATLEETCAAVQAAALTCQPQVAGYATSTADFHRVVGYEPAAGTEVDAGSVVTVGYLEQPDAVTVPSVLNMDPTQACQTLQAAFLQCAPVADWQTRDLNIVQHQDIAPGTSVATGTAVPFYYETIGPVPLNRFKSDGQEARYLTIGGAPPGAWDPQPPIGGVYAAGEAGVPGLTVVYQFHCQPDCLEGRSFGYYYSQGTGPPTDNWKLDGPAFSCFPNPVPGTVPLQALFSDVRRAWAFAPQPSGEYDFHTNPNNGAYTYKFTICHIWPR